MMRTIILLTVVLTFAGASFGQMRASASTRAVLLKLEHQAWDAFGKGDGKFFKTHMTSDGLVADGSGISDRATSIKMINTKPCEVKSYSFSDFKVTMLDANTALDTYAATIDATCGGQKIPSKVYASTVVVRRGGRWLAAFHQESSGM